MNLKNLFIINALVATLSAVAFAQPQGGDAVFGGDESPAPNPAVQVPANGDAVFGRDESPAPKRAQSVAARPARAEADSDVIAEAKTIVQVVDSGDNFVPATLPQKASALGSSSYVVSVEVPETKTEKVERVRTGKPYRPHYKRVRTRTSNGGACVGNGCPSTCELDKRLTAVEKMQKEQGEQLSTMQKFMHGLSSAVGGLQKTISNLRFLRQADQVNEDKQWKTITRVDREGKDRFGAIEGLMKVLTLLLGVAIIGGIIAGIALFRRRSASSGAYYAP